MSEEEKNAPLTPWQVENQKYYQERGETPPWQEEEEALEEQEEAKGEKDTDGDPVLRKRSKQRKIKTEEELGKETPFYSEESEEAEPEVAYETYASKLPKMKKQRNKKLRNQLLLLISTFVFAILVAVYMISPYSKVGKISVTGVDKAMQAEILKQSAIPQEASIWEIYFDRSKIEQRIVTKNKRLKSVQFSLIGVHDISFLAKEFLEVAYKKVAEEYIPILENGYLLPEKKTTDKNRNKKLPVLIDFVDKSEQIENFIEEYQKLPEALNQLIKTVQLTPTKSNPDLVTMDMTDGNKVKISIEDITEKLPYYPRVSKSMKKKGIVDMEVAIYSYSYAAEKEEKEKEKEKAAKEEVENKTTSSESQEQKEVLSQ